MSGPDPPEWHLPLYYRRGAPHRLGGVHVFHDFDWLSRFSDNRTQFRNGQSLAVLAIQECPAGKGPALLLTQDPEAVESSIESDSLYALVVRIDDYRQHQLADAATSYYARRSEARVTSLAGLRHLPKVPEVFRPFLDEHLTVDHISEWLEDEPSRLQNLSQLVSLGSDPEAVVVFDDETKARAIADLVAQGHSQEFWAALTEEDPDLATKLAAARIELDRRTAIEEFRASITTHSSDESFWQSFFKRYPWTLQLAFAIPVFKLGDETYLGGKMAVGPQGRGGVATDFLFSDESSKSFAVVELKTPDTPLVGSVYRGTRGSDLDQEVYSASAELSGAIVQTRNQIAVALDDFDVVLRPTFDDMRRVHASGVLIIGLVDDLSDRQLASFNLIRRGLHDLTVITFDELLGRLDILFNARESQSQREGLEGDARPSGCIER